MSGPETGPVVIVQTAIGGYRKDFVDELRVRLPDGLEIVTGTESFEASTQLRLSSPVVRADVRNLFFAGRRLLWQRGVARRAIGAGVAVLELNPRVASTWFVLAMRRLTGRRTVLWGHAWSRSGRSGPTERLRRLMRAGADAVIVYTETERAELQPHVPGRPVYAAPNALYPRSAMRASTDGRQWQVIWTGRLVAAKKPALAVLGFHRAIDRLPAETSLLIVGEGPERGAIEQLVDDLGLGGRVVLTDYVGDRDRLGEFYDSALVSLSTGYVGLSLVQSLAFGVPMLYARDEPHAPEIEAASDLNSQAFRSDDAAALAEALVGFFARREDWLSRRAAVSAACRQRYSAEAMADGFVAAIRGEELGRRMPDDG